MSFQASAAPLATATGTAPRVAILAVLGVVYGDIGTSPLYAFKLSLEAAGPPGPESVLGVLSLIFWSLTLVVTVKYVLIVMRADNRGEGGVLALTALALRCASRRGRRHRLILAVGLLGAALFYGDCVITPAISVLSAVEGLEVAAPSLHPFVVPAAVVLLLGLFLLQSGGTARMGRLFGPVMVLWFATLAVFGLRGILLRPEVLEALDPAFAFALLAADTWRGLAILGAVVLAVTGAEALYADLGHFGRRAIGRTWLSLVMPALLLNYFGQGALVLERPSALQNPFFHLAPEFARLPLVLLASAATVIAAQAVISGAFSITQQAVQLGYLPRLAIRHTSAEARGQVYLPLLNGLLLAVVLAVVLGFQSSAALGSAYGIAVTGTMAVTTLLAAVAMRSVAGWSLWLLLPLGAFFLAIDLLFFSANLQKVMQGGWLPLGLAALLFLLMTTWIAGRRRLLERRIASAVSLEDFLGFPTIDRLVRVPGSACYLVAEPRYAPTALLHNLKHNKVLHQQVAVLAIVTEDVPRVADAERATVVRLEHGFWRVILRYGFLEQPDLPSGLALCRAQGLALTIEETSFFVGHEKVTVGRLPGLAPWRKRLFILLHRAMVRATDFYHVPPNRVVELGGQVEI